MAVSWRRVSVRLHRQFDSRTAGLRVLNGQPPEPWPFSMSRRVLLAVADIDHHSGVAAVWLVHKTSSRTVVEHLDRYEVLDNVWQYVGGGGSIHPFRGERHFPSNRVCAAILGPTHLLQQIGNCAGRARWQRGWIGCTALRVSVEVARIQVGQREVPVPAHGYLIVVWKGSPVLASRGRPRIVALDSGGTALTELGPGSYLDSATLTAAADYD